MTTLNNILRAAESIPWAIAPEKLAEICAVLELRANGGHLSPDVIAANTADRRRTTTAFGGAIAVIPIHGVIGPRMNMMTEYSGGTSCEQLGSQIRAAIENPQVSAIVLDVDSPGGSVAGIQELSERIRAWRDIKPITAVANHMMASAAYWLASAATDVVAAPSAEVGSIGVYTIHTDASQADLLAGVKRTLIKAGTYKAEDLACFPLSDDAKAHLEAKVADYYDAFSGGVAVNRGTSKAAVQAGYGQGQCLNAKAALSAKLIDRIATLDDVIADLSGTPANTARLAASANASLRADASPTVTAETASESPSEVPDDEQPTCPDCGALLDGDDCPDCDNDTTGDASAAAIARRDLALRSDASRIAAMTESSFAPVAALALAPSITPAPRSGGLTPVLPLPVIRVKAPQAKEIHVSDENTTAHIGADDNAREREILEMSALAEMHAMQDQLPKWIGSNAKLDGQTGVRAQITAALRERLTTGPQTRTHRVDLTAGEEKEYSYARAFLSAVDGSACFERDLSEELAKNLPKGYTPQNGPHSLFMPTTIRAAGLDSGTATKGNELKFVQYGGFIDMLRNKTRTIQAGARMLAGLDGPVTFAKQNGAGTFSWLAENGGSDVSESNLLLTTVTLTAKTGQSTTSFSRQLLRQAVEDVESLVRNDLAAVHAVGVDAAALNGLGSSNQPTGVANASGVGIVALGTNGAAPTYANIINQQVQIGQANADEDIGSGAFITTPGIKGTLQTTTKLSNSIAQAIWGDDDTVAGRPGFSTNQVLSNLTKGTGTALHQIFYGIWQQLLIGEWGAMEILVDPLRLKKQGMIEVTSFQMIDIAVRYAAAFSLIKDAISTF